MVLAVTAHTIGVFLADDNLIVREGVRALLSIEDDIAVVGVAADYDELVAGATATAPHVLVTDIRMPPSFQREGIDAAKEIRRRHPGTGVVVLSQYDDPGYAVSLLSEGAAGYGYLLKDRIAEVGELAKAIRSVATGGSVLDPKIVDALVAPARVDGALTPAEDQLLQMVAEGRSIKEIAVSRSTTPADVASSVEALFVTLADGLSSGNLEFLDHLKRLQRAIVERDEQGEQLSRLLPGGVAEKLRAEGRRVGETEELLVTVLMSDIRGYTSIAERTDPSNLARQLGEHRAEMNRAVLDVGGTVMQFVGDAVMAVFGAPQPQADHAARSVQAALAMHAAQQRVNDRWAAVGLEPFGLGIGLSTGPVAAALLGSEDRLEYSLVGDTVNLTQRVQQWAEPGETVMLDATFRDLGTAPDCEALDPATVKGRAAPVLAYRFPPRSRDLAGAS